MAGKKKNNNGTACKPLNTNGSTCTVEAIVGVDERGQMVLPKDLRERAGIGAGDKLAVTSWERDGQVCCITLVKVEDLVDMVKDQLGPVVTDALKRE